MLVAGRNQMSVPLKGEFVNVMLRSYNDGISLFIYKVLPLCSSFQEQPFDATRFLSHHVHVQYTTVILIACSVWTDPPRGEVEFITVRNPSICLYVYLQSVIHDLFTEGWWICFYLGLAHLLSKISEHTNHSRRLVSLQLKHEIHLIMLTKIKGIPVECSLGRCVVWSFLPRDLRHGFEKDKERDVDINKFTSLYFSHVLLEQFLKICTTLATLPGEKHESLWVSQRLEYFPTILVWLLSILGNIKLGQGYVYKYDNLPSNIHKSVIGFSVVCSPLPFHL